MTTTPEEHYLTPAGSFPVNNVQAWFFGNLDVTVLPSWFLELRNHDDILRRIAQILQRQDRFNDFTRDQINQLWAQVDSLWEFVHALEDRLDLKDEELESMIEELDDRVDAVELKNAEQDGRLDVLDTQVGGFDGRIDALEANDQLQDQKNLQQDESILDLLEKYSELQVSDAQLDGRVTTLESLWSCARGKDGTAVYTTHEQLSGGTSTDIQVDVPADRELHTSDLVISVHADSTGYLGIVTEVPVTAPGVAPTGIATSIEYVGALVGGTGGGAIGIEQLPSTNTAPSISLVDDEIQVNFGVAGLLDPMPTTFGVNWLQSVNTDGTPQMNWTALPPGSSGFMVPGLGVRDVPTGGSFNIPISNAYFQNSGAIRVQQISNSATLPVTGDSKTIYYVQNGTNFPDVALIWVPGLSGDQDWITGPDDTFGKVPAIPTCVGGRYVRLQVNNNSAGNNNNMYTFADGDVVSNTWQYDGDYFNRRVLTTWIDIPGPLYSNKTYPGSASGPDADDFQTLRFFPVINGMTMSQFASANVRLLDVQVRNCMNQGGGPVGWTDTLEAKIKRSPDLEGGSPSPVAGTFSHIQLSFSPNNYSQWSLSMDETAPGSTQYKFKSILYQPPKIRVRFYLGQGAQW